MPIITKPLNEETKYKLADGIAKGCNNISPQLIQEHGKFYFREIINSPIKVNNQVAKLSEMFLEDDARHITNLVMQRLQAPALIKATISTTIDESSYEVDEPTEDSE